MSKVAVLKTSPSTVVEDYGMLMRSMGYQKAVPKDMKTIQKLNLSWALFYPSCSTPQWELEGVLKTLVDDGYKDIDAKMGVVRADAGYLSRGNVQMIADLGATPFARPKKHPRFLASEGPTGRRCC